MFPMMMFLGFGWTRAGVEKLISPQWWSGQALDGWLASHQTTAIPFMAPVAQHVFRPAVVPLALIVMVVQPLIGFSFFTRYRLRIGLYAAMLLNAVFMSLGQIDPSVLYMVLQLSVLVALDLGVIGNSPRQPRREMALAWGLGALLNVPFISTLTPSGIIGDPAVMLMTVCLIGGLTEMLLLITVGEMPIPTGLSSIMPTVGADNDQTPHERDSSMHNAYWDPRHEVENYTDNDGYPIPAPRNRYRTPAKPVHQPSRRLSHLNNVDHPNWSTAEHYVWRSLREPLPGEQHAKPYAPDADRVPYNPHTGVPAHDIHTMDSAPSPALAYPPHTDPYQPYWDDPQHTEHPSRPKDDLNWDSPSWSLPA